MGCYIINKIYLENFKIYDKVYLDIGETNKLLILDGPNGFGKTSIFDAIELTLTGEISRLSAIRTDTYESSVVSKNPYKDMVIIIEFKNNDSEETIVICKRITKIDNPKKNRINNPMNLKELCRTYRLKDIGISDNLKIGDIDWDKQEIINQDDLNKIFNNNLNDYYKDYYYIPQENRLHFLNKNDKDRMKIISDLMNTSKYEDYLRKIKSARDNSKKIIARLEQEYANLNDINQKLNKTKKKLSYKKVIKWNDDINWDRENIIIENEEYKISILKKLLDIKTFKKYYGEFCNERFNNKINYFIEDKNLIILEKYYKNKKYVENNTDIREKFITLNKYKELKDKLTVETLNENIENINIYFKNKLNIKDLVLKINELEELKKHNKNFENVLSDLLSLRENIERKFIQIVEDKNIDIDSKSCPLCGNEWDDLGDLLSNIKSKEEYYNTYENTNIKKINDLKNYIQTNYIDEILKNIEIYLKEYSYIEEIYYDLRFLIEKEDIYKLFENFIDLDMKQNLNSIKSNQNIKEILYTNLTNRKKNISEDYIKEKQNIKFNNIYIDVFNGSDLNVKNLKDTDIDDKINYINDLFLNEELNKYSDNIKKQEKISNQLEKMNSIYSNLKEMYKIYEYEIKKYKSKLIKEIEIPFYLYSGRILQSHECGNGILIKEEQKKEISRIKFIFSHDAEHDVLNCMSSGQLSAIVLAFTLALNRVYHKGKFTTLLIDDPIQTMDEINIASFVDILRNEFSNRQLVISTHEEEFSRYIAYKFKKYGYDYKMFNVKDEVNKII